ncbi:MAG TPA: hypothetical protein VK335_33400 [Bryobacteraceae bacterium]|nr:hypothetical protein [Bryobacteraceae bacterium]
MTALIRICVLLAWLVMLPWVVVSLAAFFVAAISHRWVVDVYIHDVYFVLPSPFVACLACILIVPLALATSKCFRRRVDATHSNPIS